MRIDAKEHKMAHLWRAVNADTGEEIRNAAWADEGARLCGVYAFDSDGFIKIGLDREPVVETQEVNVRLEWIGDPEMPMRLRCLRVVALQ